MMPLEPSPGAIVAASTQDFLPGAPVPQLIKVALTYKGKRRLVKQQSHLLVRDVLKNTTKHVDMKRPMILVDRDGFEVGFGVSLAELALGCENDILELTLQIDDDWDD